MLFPVVYSITILFYIENDKGFDDWIILPIELFNSFVQFIDLKDLVIV